MRRLAQTGSWPCRTAWAPWAPSWALWARRPTLCSSEVRTRRRISLPSRWTMPSSSATLEAPARQAEEAEVEAEVEAEGAAEATVRWWLPRAPLRRWQVSGAGRLPRPLQAAATAAVAAAAAAAAAAVAAAAAAAGAAAEEEVVGEQLPQPQPRLQTADSWRRRRQPRRQWTRRRRRRERRTQRLPQLPWLPPSQLKWRPFRKHTPQRQEAAPAVEPTPAEAAAWTSPSRSPK